MTNPADLSSFQNGQVPVVGQQDNTWSNFSGTSSNKVLLQTTEANILNLNQNNIAKGLILFDSGTHLHNQIIKGEVKSCTF